MAVLDGRLNDLITLVTGREGVGMSTAGAFRVMEIYRNSAEICYEEGGEYE